MLDEKPLEIETQSGVKKTYIFSKFPAIAGREIFAKYPTSILPKIGDYLVSEETMLKVLAYVQVTTGDTKIALATRDLVNNHVPDWETLAKIEWGMLEYNSSFFGNGKSFDFLKDFGATMKAWITSTLTDLLAQSSQAARPRSKNSKQTTR